MYARWFISFRINFNTVPWDDQIRIRMTVRSAPNHPDVSWSGDTATEGKVCLFGGLSRIFHAPEGFIGKAFKGAAVVDLLQSLDNAANGALRKRPKGEMFSTFLKKDIGCKLHNVFYRKISN